MYFHGLEGLCHQVTRMALSGDAINFVAQPQILAKPYLRIFEYENETYAIAMPSQIYRYNESAQIFGEGPLLFERDMRRCAVIVRNSKLNVFWTGVGDVLESILFSTIDLKRENGNGGQTREILRSSGPNGIGKELANPFCRRNEVLVMGLLIS